MASLNQGCPWKTGTLGGSGIFVGGRVEQCVSVNHYPSLGSSVSLQVPRSVFSSFLLTELSETLIPGGGFQAG